MRLMGATKNLANTLFDIFLPRFCCSCLLKLRIDQDTICDSCISKIQRSTAARLNQEFERKFAGKKIISSFYAPFVFEKDRELQYAIHALKYDKRFLVGVFLGKQVALEIKKEKPDWKFDLVIPIPLHHLKKAERGYNQAYYIASGLGRIFEIKASDGIVKRIKFTESQTTMNLAEREKNISDAFIINKKKTVVGKNILLVDDVITTGATISECGRILLEAGANKIYAASIAIAD